MADLNPDTKQAVSINVGMNPYLITNYDRGRYSESCSSVGQGLPCPIYGILTNSEAIKHIGQYSNKKDQYILILKRFKQELKLLVMKLANTVDDVSDC